MASEIVELEAIGRPEVIDSARAQAGCACNHYNTFAAATTRLRWFRAPSPVLRYCAAGFSPEASAPGWWSCSRQRSRWLHMPRLKHVFRAHCGAQYRDAAPGSRNVLAVSGPGAAQQRFTLQRIRETGFHDGTHGADRRFGRLGFYEHLESLP